MAILTIGTSKTYATIQGALDVASEYGGDELHVYPGATGMTYTESLDLRPGAGWLKAVTIKPGNPGDKITLASTGASQAMRGDAAYRPSGMTAQLILEDIIFDGWDAASNGVLYLTGGGAARGGFILRRSKFINCTDRKCISILVNDTSWPTLIEDCEFIGSGSPGSGSNGAIITDTFHATIRNCVFDLPTNVQALYGTAELIAHNVVYCRLNSGSSTKAFRGGAGNATGGGPGYIANIIENAGTGGANAIDATDGTYTGRYGGNLIYGPFTADFGAGTDDGNNITGSDPLLTNPAAGDFTLQSGSPAVRAIAKSALCPSTFEGVARSDPTDMGPYELALGTTVDSITVVDDDTIKLNLASLVTSDSTWTDAGNYTITPSGGAAAVSVISAVVTDAGMSITLTTSEHTNSGSYDVAWAGLTDITDGNEAYTGSGTAPTLSSVSATGENTLRVTFSEPMATTDLETLAKYSVAPVVAGGPAVSVTAATREAGANPTYVDLTISDAVAGKAYTLSIASGLTDKALNPLGSTSGNFTSPATTVASVSRTATTVTLNFDRPVLVTSTHTTAGNYTTTPSGGAAAVTVASAAVNDPTIASSVTLTTGEHTNGGSYLLEWDGLASITDGSQSYTGVGVAPTVGTIVVLSDTTLRVPFSEAMATTGLETLGRYTIAPVTAGGPAITVSAVVREAGASLTYVDLTFSETIAGKAYRLSIATGLTDKALNPLGAATADFTARDTYLASIEIVSTNRIVATLARRALYDPDLVTPANWQIRRTDPQFGLTPSISEIVADAEDFPQEFTLTTSNHTAGQGYEITYVGP